MIGYGWQGPFHIQKALTEEETIKAIKNIDGLNQSMREVVERKNIEWKNSEKFKVLQADELAKAKE